MATVRQLYDSLQPDTLLERFAARKQNKIAPTKEFLEIKGMAGQVQHDDIKVNVRNELIGFKCLHYSVTESSPQVDVIVAKKATGQEVEFGIRTVQDTAKEGTDFMPLNKVIQMKKHENEKTFSIPIIDNQAW